MSGANRYPPPVRSVNGYRPDPDTGDISLSVGGGDFPPGSILMYGGTSAPTGWLLCNGAAVSRSTYADLFAIIGIAFGAGDTTTTFNLPDMRQRFPLGKAASGTGATLGGTGGSIDHTHDVDIAEFSSGDNASASLSPIDGNADDFVWYLDVNEPHHHQINPPNTTSTSNNPPFVALNFIIKF